MSIPQRHVYSGSTTALAVFDSGLENLRMPLLRVPSPDPDAPEGTQHVVKDVHEPVASLAQQYFEWVGTVDEGDSRLIPCFAKRLPRCDRGLKSANLPAAGNHALDGFTELHADPGAHEGKERTRGCRLAVARGVVRRWRCILLVDWHRRLWL